MASKKMNIMEMVNLAFKNGYIDDQFGNECTCEFLGILSDPWKDKMYLVPINKVTTLNPLYYDEDEGTLHLAKNSMGRFDAGITSNTVSCTMEKQLQIGVERFNKENVFINTIERHSYFQSLQLICRSDWETAKKGAKNHAI